MLTRRQTLIGSAVAFTGIASGPRAQTLDKVSFGTNWVAEAEHGGHYQALVDGTYKKYGLDVTIVQGGPSANNRMALAVGKLDFYMGANMIQAFAAVEQKVPTLVVAAMFQKDPQVLISHPGQGLDRFEDLKKANAIFISKDGMATYYPWLRSVHGFSDANVRPYTFNAAPFIADKKSVQQGYVTSEPYQAEKQGGFKPNIFLLTDYGFNTYSTTIETTKALVANKPDVVRRFVEASIVGWYNYIYGDNKAANALIKRENPEMTDDVLANSIAKMKEYGIVDSGDSLKLGVGALSEATIASFYDKMVKAGVVSSAIDHKQAFTTQFVNKGVGLDLRPKN